MTDIVNPPTISSLPAAPLPTDTPTAFNTKSFALLGALDPMVTQINAVADATEQNATAANERASSAASSALTATTKAEEAAIDADRLASLEALWLGSAAVDPTVGRNDSGLVAGNAYVNTSSGLLRAYNGVAWVNGYNVVAGVESLNGVGGNLQVKTVGGASLLGEGDVAINSAPAVSLTGLDVNCSGGANVYFTKTISANSTFTFSNPPEAGTAFAFALQLTNTSGTVSWPASVRWPDNTAPTLTAGRTHVFIFSTNNGGVTWRGSVNPNYTG